VHARHAQLFEEADLIAIDLTPAAIGPTVVPPVNLEEHLNEPNVNLITCGRQATIPIVAAVTRVCEVPPAEIVSTVASRSVGPGTRQNIDEFTRTTARGLETIGHARRGKAIIILNLTEPPLIMRNTVNCALWFDDDKVVAIEEMCLVWIAAVCQRDWLLPLRRWPGTAFVSGKVSPRSSRARRSSCVAVGAAPRPTGTRRER